MRRRNLEVRVGVEKGTVAKPHNRHVASRHKVDELDSSDCLISVRSSVLVW